MTCVHERQQEAGKVLSHNGLGILYHSPGWTRVHGVFTGKIHGLPAKRPAPPRNYRGIILHVPASCVNELASHGVRAHARPIRIQSGVTPLSGAPSVQP